MKVSNMKKIIVNGKTVTLAGHAAIPGSGPETENCGSCKHSVLRLASKKYLKCSLNRNNWTSGRKSDVLYKDPSCSKWEGGEHDGIAD